MMRVPISKLKHFRLKGHAMNIPDAELATYEESDFDETQMEFPVFLRPQFKDANVFGHVCRSLAIPAKPVEEYVTQ